MAAPMVPCMNPKLCGVKSHHLGTASACKATRSQGSKKPASRFTPGVPSAAAPTRVTPYTADEVSNIAEAARKLQRKSNVMESKVNQQIKDYVKERHGDGMVEVDDPNVMRSSNPFVEVTFKPGGRVEYLRVPRRSVIPDDPGTDKLSQYEIDALKRNERVQNKLETRVLDCARSNITNYVTAHMEESGHGAHDELRYRDEDVLRGKSDVEVTVFNKGEERNYYYIPRSEVFPS